MDQERIRYWLGVGAEASDSVEGLMSKAAPEVLKDLQTQRLNKRAKLAAKRRGVKKKTAAPAKKAVEKKTVEKKAVEKKPAAKKAKTSAAS
jgi:hypothetical protein